VPSHFFVSDYFSVRVITSLTRNVATLQTHPSCCAVNKNLLLTNHATYLTLYIFAPVHVPLPISINHWYLQWSVSEKRGCSQARTAATQSKAFITSHAGSSNKVRRFCAGNSGMAWC